MCILIIPNATNPITVSVTIPIWLFTAKCRGHRTIGILIYEVYWLIQGIEKPYAVFVYLLIKMKLLKFAV